MQVQSKENRIVANSRPMVINLTSSVATSSSSVNSPIASRSPVILKASSLQVGLSGRPDASEFKIPVPTQRRVLKVGKGKHVANEHQGCSGKSEIPEGSEDSKLRSRNWPHHFIYHQTVYLTWRESSRS